MKNENMIRINTFRTEKVKEVYTEGEFILADYYPTVMRIIRSEAKALIKSKSIHGDKLTAEGSVEFTVMYVSEDGALTSCTQALPFSYTGDFPANESNIYSISTSVSYLNTRALSPQKLYLKATVEIQTSHTDTIEFSAFEPDLDGHIYTRKTDLNSFETVCKGRKPLKITDEISTSEELKEIIRYDVSFSETEQKILTGKLIAKADMFLKIVYLTSNGKIISHEQRIPISQILDMEGISDNTVCGTSFTLTDCRTVLSNDAKSFTYEITVDVEASGYSTCKYILCDDAFSDKAEINCKKYSFKNCCFSKIAKEQSFRETFTLGLYDKLHDISAIPSILTTDYDKDSELLTVSGTFSCKALYTDENGEFASAEKEIPFILKIQTDGKADRIETSTDMTLKSFAYIENDSTSAELRIDCTYKGFLFTFNDVTVVAEAAIGETYTTSDNNKIILYYAEENEAVWDISKKYKKDPQHLMKINGLTEDVLKKPTMMRL